MGVGMNERIEQLADQAGADIWGHQVMASRHFDIEKFAELIVRECVDLLPADMTHGPDSRPLLQVFKEHFGVAE
jgi:hypothetical protein